MDVAISVATSLAVNLTKTDIFCSYTKEKKAYNQQGNDANDAPASPIPVPPPELSWRCQICNDMFRTQYQLRKHKTETGHVTQRGRPARRN